MSDHIYSLDCGCVECWKVKCLREMCDYFEYFEDNLREIKCALKNHPK